MNEIATKSIDIVAKSADTLSNSILGSLVVILLVMFFVVLVFIGWYLYRQQENQRVFNNEVKDILVEIKNDKTMTSEVINIFNVMLEKCNKQNDDKLSIILELMKEIKRNTER